MSQKTGFDTPLAINYFWVAYKQLQNGIADIESLTIAKSCFANSGLTKDMTSNSEVTPLDQLRPTSPFNNIHLRELSERVMALHHAQTGGADVLQIRPTTSSQQNTPAQKRA